MGGFLTQLDALNTGVLALFGTEQISYQQRLNSADVGNPVLITAIPLDPLRLEGQANGNFTIRWVKTIDLIDWQGNPLQPVKGDVITLVDSELTKGGVYTLIQIQEDVGGGVRLILEKRAT